MKHGSSTDIGRAREVQEDALLVEPPLFAVADGMGGHAAGDVAAQMAVSIISEQVGELNRPLRDAIIEANRRIFERATGDSSLSGMGTTITAVLTSPKELQVAHVGDSRAYLLRDGTLERLTRDHSVVERMVSMGKLTPEEASHHPQRSALERALGVEDQVRVDVATIEVRAGDRILLCTDGLTSHLDDDEIVEILLKVDDPEAASRRLVEQAVTAGGLDNVSTIVLDYPGERIGTSSPTTRRRPRRWRLVALILSVTFAVTVLLARVAISTSWYVGEQDGRVAIYKGIPESVGSIELSKVEDETTLQVNQLPEVYRERVKEGIRVKSLSDARNVVRELESRSNLATFEEGPIPIEGSS